MSLLKLPNVYHVYHAGQLRRLSVSKPCVFVPFTNLSCACKSLEGFQFGSNMITTFAPVKFSPSPPALVDTKHKEMLGSRLNSLTRRVLSAALVDPSKRLYTIPLLITNSSKMSRSWKETDIVLNDSVSCDKLILKSMVRNLAKCKSTKIFSISKTNIWQRIESLRNLCPQGFSGLPWTGRWGIFGIL